MWPFLSEEFAYLLQFSNVFSESRAVALTLGLLLLIGYVGGMKNTGAISKKKKKRMILLSVSISATLDLWSSGFCWSHWSISVSVPRGGRTDCLSCCLRINVQLWQTANADFLVAAVVYLNSVPALSSIFNRLGKTGLKHSPASKSRPPWIIRLKNCDEISF